MGLFDIFRRHKKEEQATSPAESAADQPASSTPSETPASSQPSVPASQAPVQSTAPTVSSQPTNPTQSTTPVESAQPTMPASQASQATAPAPVSSEPAESEPAKEPVASSQPSAPTSVAPESDSSTSVEQESEAPASQDATPTEPESMASEDQQAQSSAPEETEAATEQKYDRGLEKSRTGFGARLNRFLANFRHVDEDFFDDLEDMLIESDVGYDMAMKLSDELREEVKLENAKTKQQVSNVIIEKMVELYDAAGKDENADLNMAKSGPTVIMFVGVNGAGKTTTIGKMAALFKKQGKKVLLAAADTFRAGATEQLDVWAKRDGVDIVTGPENGDPAAVVFDAVQKAKKEDYDILFVDTAGRLQNKVNLMKELAKMKRILTREIPDAPHEVLLVLDATTGQNALNQAKLFKESTDVTGIVLTKLDGTARGGIVLAIRNELHLPVKYVGLGEQVDDLQKFNASDFVYGLFKGLVEVDE
ncbi:signal recognition particle-docking protein FtsY [Limosilactobacillus sp.]|jgi:fused signal recognition particle receptor|uniref:signal recognition particle-docking protein FtsY n=1 Tax=Limosilactobacillus sp. TaxID=2773925 RepID=UPI0025B8952D|nr:signal recognition particle-docking protein FtsY [Limosilactobacillus sp.]MCH3923021.1 signal recognition particle-docking protein FtsY [Limosilactobacillus sp.]MCH3927704.1 signal recognition particle-docking protein FtsY [Limosilactobacillus sp.]